MEKYWWCRPVSLLMSVSHQPAVNTHMDSTQTATLENILVCLGNQENKNLSVAESRNSQEANNVSRDTILSSHCHCFVHLDKQGKNNLTLPESPPFHQGLLFLEIARIWMRINHELPVGDKMQLHIRARRNANKDGSCLDRELGQIQPIGFRCQLRLVGRSFLECWAEENSVSDLGLEGIPGWIRQGP